MYAFISVYNKNGLASLANSLLKNNINIIASKGTANYLADFNILVQSLEDLTSIPELLNGRVKSLQPLLHAGILAKNYSDLAEIDFPAIDLVVVNLYPFIDKMGKEITHSELVDYIDIGGHALIRSAIKNQQRVSILTSPKDYERFIGSVESGSIAELNTQLAIKALDYLQTYDRAVLEYFTSRANIKNNLSNNIFPDKLTESLQLDKSFALNYGENPHQKAAVYQNINANNIASLFNSNRHQNNNLSYNNILDIEVAIKLILDFNSNPTCFILKHNNISSAAVAKTALEAYEKAYKADSKSAFGGIIVFNCLVELDTMQSILDKPFIEILLAPRFTTDALKACKSKPKLKILSNSNWVKSSYRNVSSREIIGGIIQQTNTLVPLDYEIVTKIAPTKAENNDLQFAWNIAKHITSNAIAIVKDGQTLGLGIGQTSRVFSVEIAIIKAKQNGFNLDGACLASDAFFPFIDCIELASKTGIAAIIQPGGSKNDQQVISKADELNLSMIFTRQRAFRH